MQALKALPAWRTGCSAAALGHPLRKAALPTSHATTSSMPAVVCEKVSYTSDELQLTGYKACLDEGENKRAAVLVAHTAIGPHDPFIQQIIIELAQAGYVAFALDMYGAADIVTGAAKEAANAPYKEKRSLISKHASTALKLVQDMDDVDENRIGAIGYCFGGKVVLDLARTGADLRAVVSFHGVLDRLGACTAGGEIGEDGSVVKPRIVAFHGYADPFTTPGSLQEFMSELEEMKAQYEVRVSGSKVLHSFMRPEKTTPEDERMGLQYNESVAKEAWDATLGLLRETLRP